MPSVVIPDLGVLCGQSLRRHPLADHRQFICVTCPVGCSLDVLVEGSELKGIQGHACKRGITFVQEELTAPKRVLTTTVRVQGGTLPLVPVRSSGPLPKGVLLQVASQLRQLVLQAPVSAHQIVIHDVLHTDVDIITSREVGRAE